MSDASDVSLDEEDEALVWRVFYGDYEKRMRAQGGGGDADDAPADLFNSDDDISDLSEVEDLDLVARYEELKHGDAAAAELDDEAQKRLIISLFTEDQMDRFESYRRMRVNKPGVKKVCSGVLGHSVAQNVAVVLAGLLKLLLGEIITRAMECQERDHKARLIADIDLKKRQKRDELRALEEGLEPPVVDTKLEYYGDRPQPLQPEHIREAWRLYRLESGGALSHSWRTQGDADGKFFR
jgi:transcription initiation factor TFIID subunit 11